MFFNTDKQTHIFDRRVARRRKIKEKKKKKTAEIAEREEDSCRGEGERGRREEVGEGRRGLFIPGGRSQNHTNSRLAKREIFTVVACRLIWKQD